MPQFAPIVNAPNHYYQPIASILAGQLVSGAGQQLGDGLGYAARHLLFGNNAGEEQALAAAAHTRETTDELQSARLRELRAYNPDLTDEQVMAAAKNFHMQDFESARDARGFVPAPQAGIARGQNATYNEVTNPENINDRTQVGGSWTPAPAKPIEQTRPQDLFQMPQQAYAGEEIAPSGPAGGPSLMSGQTPGQMEGQAPSPITPETQRAQAYVAAKTPPPESPMSIASSPQESHALAQQRAQELAQIPSPPLPQDPQTKLMGQALSQHWGAAVSKMTAIGAGQYSDASAAQLIGIQNSTMEKIMKASEMADKIRGLKPSIFDPSDVLNRQAYAVWKDPLAFSKLPPEQQAAFEHSGKIFEGKLKNADAADQAKLQEFATWMPSMSKADLMTQLAAQKMGMDIRVAKGQADSYDIQNRVTAGTYDTFTKPLQQMELADKGIGLKMKALDLYNKESFGFRQMQLATAREEITLKEYEATLPYRLNAAQLQNATARMGLEQTAMSTKMSGLQFIYGQEAKEAIGRMSVYEKLIGKMDQEIGKITLDPKLPLAKDDDPWKIAQLNQVAAYQKDKAVYQGALDKLKSPSSDNGKNSPGVLIRDLVSRTGTNYDAIIQEAYKGFNPMSTDPKEIQAVPWDAPHIYQRYTKGLVTRDPHNTRLNTDQLPLLDSRLPNQMPGAAGGAAIMLALYGDKGKKPMSREQFFAAQIQGHPLVDKASPENSFIFPHPDNMTKMYNLYYNAVQTRNAQP